MKYISTRDESARGYNSAYAIRHGLADDGGLFVPRSIPRVDLNFISELASLPYRQKATKLLSLFLTDYTYEELSECAAQAYNSDNFGDACAPIAYLPNGTAVLELWHGPTSAFKDMALQIMPRLFLLALDKCGEKKKALILVATSGDTGKAALEGFKDLPNVFVKVFYPTDGVSVMQKRQMQTQAGKNLSVTGICGNFDDAQNEVKAAFSSNELALEFEDHKLFLSSANSINWGRLAPQIVYYFSAYCDMYRNGAIDLGESIDVAVPTGNFGDILAGFIAKLMGLPIGKLICASNSNNVLTEFLRSGRYDKNRAFHTTISPSMDILISSNLERLLYFLFGAKRCAELMKSLDLFGSYTVSQEELLCIREHFEGYFATDEECAECIKSTYEKDGYLIDTHTAVAMCAKQKFMHEYKTSDKILVLSTATPYKFAADVLQSAFGVKETPENSVKKLFELSGVKIPSPIAAIWERKIIHPSIISKDSMNDSIIEFISRI